MSEKDQKQIFQDPCSFVSKSLLTGSRRGKMEVERPLQYYAALMRHDAYDKVGGRIRQRRWSH